MHFLRETYRRVDTPFLRHLLFWGVIFLFHIVTAYQAFYSSVGHLMGVIAVMTALQVIGGVRNALRLDSELAG